MDDMSQFETEGDGRARFPIACIDNSGIERISDERGKGEFIWVNLRGATAAEIERTGKALELHPLTIEDMLEFDQRAKIEEFDKYAYIVSYGATTDASDKDMLVEVHIIYSADFLVTVAREESAELGKLQDLARVREFSGHEILHSVLDVLVDSYAPVLDTFDAEIERLEEMIVQRDLRGRELEIHHVRRRLGRIDRVVHRQLESFTRIREMLSRMPDHHAEDFPYFRDLQDHLIHVGESADAMRDRIAGLFELYMAALDNRQNIVMKQFTVIAGIFLPLSVLTGFFGMNFEWMVREVSSGTAFLVLGVVLPIAILVAILSFIASRGLFRE